MPTLSGRIAMLRAINAELKTENEELKSIKESLEIALAEQGRIVDKLINELLVIKGGRN